MVRSFPTNRVNVNMNKEIVAGNPPTIRGNVNIDKEEKIARKLKIFSVDKEIKEEVPGNPPTNRENVNIDKESKK